MIASKLPDDVVKFLANEVDLFSDTDEEEISCEINGDIIELKQGEIFMATRISKRSGSWNASRFC